MKLCEQAYFYRKQLQMWRCAPGRATGKRSSGGESRGSGKQAGVGSSIAVAAVVSDPLVRKDGGEAQKKSPTQKDAASDSGSGNESDDARFLYETDLRILVTDTRNTIAKTYFMRQPMYEKSWMDNFFRRERWETHDRVQRHWQSLCKHGQTLVADVRDPIINEHVLLRDETPEVTSTDVWAYLEHGMKKRKETNAQHFLHYHMHLILVWHPP